jgi:hypothetical protein
MVALLAVPALKPRIPALQFSLHSVSVCWGLMAVNKQLAVCSSWAGQPIVGWSTNMSPRRPARRLVLAHDLLNPHLARFLQSLCLNSVV